MTKINKAKSIDQLGEFGLIDHLTQEFTAQNKSTMLGVGDDCAVIERDDNYFTLVSKEVMIENIHFDLMYVPLKQLGYKAVSCAVSDVYAMNGRPEQILLAIGMSSRFPIEAMEDFYRGINHACSFYGVDLVGGDTSSTPQGLMISITVIGKVEKDKICYRSGGNPTDILMVTGDLGRPYLGLQILEREKNVFLSNPTIQPELERFDTLVKKQLMPTARKDMVDLLESLQVIPTSMIDISDGLASEILHLCSKGKVGCCIYENKLPFHEDTLLMASDFNLIPAMCAMNGGEEYELLFSVAQSDYSKIQGNPHFTPVGYYVSASEGCYFEDNSGVKHQINAQGWRHF